MPSKKSLARTLSSLKDFSDPRMALEQYKTPGDIAAGVLHHAYMLGDIESRRVADLGCGTGVLGIGAALLGADHVTFLDIDENALAILHENLEGIDTPRDVIHAPLRSVEADTVVMNPPFGTKRRHADKQFVLAAIDSAPVVYSMHMAGSEEFIEQVVKPHGFARTHTWEYSFPIPATMPKHTKKRADVDIVAVRLERQRL